VFLVYLIAELTLVQLHGLAGHVIYINPHQVTSIRTPTNSAHFAVGTKCLLFMTNRNFVSVTDTCDQVRYRMMHPNTVDK
jgi:hypothetical protein